MLINTEKRKSCFWDTIETKNQYYEIWKNYMVYGTDFYWFEVRYTIDNIQYSVEFDDRISQVYDWIKDRECELYEED